MASDESVVEWMKIDGLSNGEVEQLLKEKHTLQQREYRHSLVSSVKMSSGTELQMGDMPDKPGGDANYEENLRDCVEALICDVRGSACEADEEEGSFLEDPEESVRCYNAAIDAIKNSFSRVVESHADVAETNTGILEEEIDGLKSEIQHLKRWKSECQERSEKNRQEADISMKRKVEELVYAKEMLTEIRETQAEARRKLIAQIADGEKENKAILHRYREADSLNNILRQYIASHSEDCFREKSPLATDTPTSNVPAPMQRYEVPTIEDLFSQTGNGEEALFKWIPPYDHEWFKTAVQKFNIPVARKPSGPGNFGKLLNKEVGPLYSDVQASGGDGQCYFHAVSQFLTCSDNYNWEIREIVCDFVEKNAEVLKTFFPHAKDEKYKRDRMVKNSRDPKWADHLDVFATACVLGIDIWIWAPGVTKGPCDYWFHFAPAECLRTGHYAMYLINMQNTHFEMITNM